MPARSKSILASMQKLPLRSPARFAALALCFCGGLTSAGAQSSPQDPLAFEVASVRPAMVQSGGGEGSTRSQIQYTADGLIMRNIDLSEMIQWAYGVEQNQVDGPAMLQTPRYDIQARAAAPAPEKTLRLMLQNLLASRFNLKVHREQKRMPVYELVVAKDGPRLPRNDAAALPASYPKERFPRVVDGGFVFTRTTMAEFAQQLTELRGIDLPVVDRTGIDGVYTITLRSAASALRDPNGPSLFTLIHEQLGLKLVAAKDPIEVIIVDHAEEPSPN